MLLSFSNHAWRILNKTIDFSTTIKAKLIFSTRLSSTSIHRLIKPWRNTWRGLSSHLPPPSTKKYLPSSGRLFLSLDEGKGSEPEWNETFVFNVSDDVPELAIKLMDSDTFSDDFVGEAKIPLEPLFSEGRIPPTVYNVVKDEEYRGEIKIGLTFIPEDNHGRYNEENFGGWRE